MRSRPARPRASRHAAPASKRRPLRLVALYFAPCEPFDMRFDVSARIFESVLPLPKHHSQSAQDLVKKTTLNPGTGGSNEKAISRKRSARRVGLGDAGGIRCRYAGITPPPPAPPAYTWSGCYIGGGGGYSTGRATQYTAPGAVVTPVAPGFRPGAVPAGVNITDQFNLSGFIGTGELGCNWQWGAWVFGIEGDGSATNKEGQAFETFLVPFLGAGRGAWVAETQERWLVTARARLGLTNFWWFGPQTMVYVTGGGAWAKIDTSEFLPGQFATTSGHLESNTRSGWTVGGGTRIRGRLWLVGEERVPVREVRRLHDLHDCSLLRFPRPATSRRAPSSSRTTSGAPA